MGINIKSKNSRIPREIVGNQILRNKYKLVERIMWKFEIIGHSW